MLVLHQAIEFIISYKALTNRFCCTVYAEAYFPSTLNTHYKFFSLMFLQQINFDNSIQT